LHQRIGDEVCRKEAQGNRLNYFYKFARFAGIYLLLIFQNIADFPQENFGLSRRGIGFQKFEIHGCLIAKSSTFLRLINSL